MHSVLARRCLLAPAFGVTLLTLLALAPQMRAQGGEPQYFAIRGARIVPVSGLPLENATVVMAHGVITAIGKDVTIPPDAWIIEGKGLTVYPGLFDSFTDVGLPAAAPAPGGATEGGGGGRRAAPAGEVSRGPEDRPGTTPWRSAADELTLSDKRIESWRNGGFTTVVSAPKGGMFPGQAAVLDLAGDRASEMVVKTPVAFPVSLQPSGGFGNFPGSLMGALAYVHQVWIDTDWSAKAQAMYEKNPGASRGRATTVRKPFSARRLKSTCWCSFRRTTPRNSAAPSILWIGGSSITATMWTESSTAAKWDMKSPAK